MRQYALMHIRKYWRMAIPSQKSFEMASKLEALISCIGGAISDRNRPVLQRPTYISSKSAAYRCQVFGEGWIVWGCGKSAQGEGVGNLPNLEENMVRAL